MATVNKRKKKLYAVTINGVDVGGAMSARISYGYENRIKSAPDGLALSVIDSDCQFCRGTVVTQDWVHVIDLLTGTLGTYVCWQRKSGAAAATGYIKYTITNPVIYACSFQVNQGGYITCTFSFECKAADETKGFADMLVPLDDQAAPTYLTAARGGWRVVSTTHGGSLTIYHVKALNFGITMPVAKACNDADLGYTCVDAEEENMTCSGSITFEDFTISTATILAQKLLAATPGDLVLRVVQSAGATSKDITIARCDFGSADENEDVNQPFNDQSLAFEINNDPGTPLTLSGDDKILTIEDAA